MLNYTDNESLDGSHFIITTPQENICILAFKKLNEEELYFNNDFLQENIYEMAVIKVTTNFESYCKELSDTIKHIFDDLLERVDDAIIYISVPVTSLKYQLILRYIEMDSNEHFKCLQFNVEDNAFCFFFNEKRTSTLDCWLALKDYFKEEYNINFDIREE